MYFAEPKTESARKQANLTKALLADLERETRHNHDISDCFACGHHMVDVSVRFCSERCRDFYDAGNPGLAQTWLQPKPRHANGMRATKTGFAINCAHCTVDFESKGLRCCSPKCEAELSKPAKARKQRRLDIPYYTVTASGHGYWQPKAALRSLGFTSVDCGFDGPAAWEKAKQMNTEASEARKAA
jgi:predicted nucleic acid-binding Zn ribbon protein